MQVRHPNSGIHGGLRRICRRLRIEGGGGLEQEGAMKTLTLIARILLGLWLAIGFALGVAALSPIILASVIMDWVKSEPRGQ